MNYRVRIQNNVKQKLASLGLSRQMLIQVYLRMREELETNPETYLGEQIVPFGNMRAYHVILVPFQSLLVFAVQLDGENLTIISVRHSAEATGEN